MRNLLASTFVLCLFTSLATAQAPTSGNIFFGYSYYNANLSGIDRVSINGWEGTLEGKVLPFIGILADFSGHYGSENFMGSDCAGCSGNFNTNIAEHNVLFGPRVSVPVGKFRPFAEAMIGVGHASLSGGPSDTSFASAIGGGLDYRIIRILAWRFQGDYVHTHLFGIGQDNVRISTGIVLRF